MIVELIAHTVVTGWGAMRDAGWVDHPVAERHWMDPELDHLAEFAGRLCYQSWDRPNLDTATSVGYLANIIKQRHFSVLEHSSATFYVAGVSRSLSHELVRHRHLSFSQVSQRYVDESDSDAVIPPALSDDIADANELRVELVNVLLTAHNAYQVIVNSMTERGYTRKQARQAARSVLPNATETRFVVTGNLRAWRDVIQKRSSSHADAEIQLLAAEVLRQLKEIAPNTFQDM